MLFPIPPRDPVTLRFGDGTPGRWRCSTRWAGWRTVPSPIRPRWNSKPGPAGSYLVGSWALTVSGRALARSVNLTTLTGEGPQAWYVSRNWTE